MRSHDYVEDPAMRRPVERLANVPEGACLHAALSFADDVVGGDAGKILAAMRWGRESFLTCLDAIGRVDEFVEYALAVADEMAEGDPSMKPMLAWKGEPLRGVTVAMFADMFGSDDVAWAKEALVAGRFKPRKCRLDDNAEYVREYGYEPRVELDIDGEVESSYYKGRTYYPSASLDLIEGRFELMDCYDCRRWCEEDDPMDYEPYDSCRHTAALVLAFAADPKSFPGCPKGLESLHIGASDLIDA